MPAVVLELVAPHSGGVVEPVDRLAEVKEAQERVVEVEAVDEGVRRERPVRANLKMSLKNNGMPMTLRSQRKGMRMDLSRRIPMSR